MTIIFVPGCLLLFMKEPGKYITVIIFVLTCFTFFYSRAWNKYNDHNICSRLDIMVMIFVPTCLVNFHLIKRSEQIQPLYLFRVASLSFYQEPGTNIMAIIFVPECLTFILSRARNKYYGHYICSRLLYFHLLKSPEQIL